MVDDLTLQGVSEPYRMLTARAEYRLRLRANNAATRLTPLAIDAGCVSAERRAWFEAHIEQAGRWRTALEREVSSSALAEGGLPVRRDGGKRSLAEWLAHKGVDLDTLAQWLPNDLTLSDIAHEVAEDAAYAPYLARQDAELRDLRASEAVRLPHDFPYVAVPGLSNEMVERLTAAQPATLAAAGRVPGITPAALSALLVHARKFDRDAA